MVSIGLRIVQILTILSSKAIGLFTFFQIILLFPGSMGITFDWTYLFFNYFGLSLVTSIFGLVFSILLFTSKSKYVYFLSFIYWILICVVFYRLTAAIWINYTTGEYSGFRNLADWQIESLIVTLIPYVYAIGCSLYFILSKDIHDYFNLK